ncbi:MAG TPA: hypothetical protein VLA00_16335 [Xanthobacteraceae bacterium]|nr:hypothetical protein [Xanthobacteraceae bacterium]
MFEDLSFGAVGAAFIAAIVSLIGLIISKEQKVSDFRQAWVDALRVEFVNYLTSINSIADALSVIYTSQAEKVSALSPLYRTLNQAHFAINLRLNSSEPHSMRVLTCMKSFSDIALDENKIKATQFKSIEVKFITAANDLLKYEWKRVKRGELTFVVTKFVAVMVLVAIVGLGAYFAPWQHGRSSPEASEAQPAQKD